MATAQNDQLQYQIAVTMIKNIGPVLAQNLIAYCGSAEKVFKTPKSKLLKVPLIGEERANDILSAAVLHKAEAELKFIEEYKIKAIFHTHDSYPKRLKDCHDAPILLYYKGNADLNQQKVMAVVGTRKISDYGKSVVKKLIEDLQGQNILVVSGMAYGVDIAAHHECVEKNIATVGVLGHGLNMLYPATHKPTAKKMLENGGLLTEYNSQDKFLPQNFPSRNRIVAGMCDAVVVVESATEGGALITANIANSYNKDVFAYPGKTIDKYSQGCNFLLKTFKANMIENAADVLKYMNWQGENNATQKPKQLALNLNKNEQIIYNIIRDNQEIEIDKLAAMTAMQIGTLAALLLDLELNNIIVSLPGKRYKIVH